MPAGEDQPSETLGALTPSFTAPFKNLWEHSPCPQLVLDSDATTVLAANDTFWAWTGLERRAVLGTAFTRLLPVGDRILWSTHCLPKLDSTGRVTEISVQVISAGGVRRAAFLTASRAPAPGTSTTPGASTGTASTRSAPWQHDPVNGEPSQVGHVLVALFGAAERRRYEEDLLEEKRRAEASEAQRALAEEGLQHLAHHDQVTGLLNRRGLQVALIDILSRDFATRADSRSACGTDVTTTTPQTGQAAGQTPGSPGRPVVFFLDLDGFKAVNDSVGHAGGDALLMNVARRLRASVRGEAVLARFAGDEFVIVDTLPQPEDVDAICRRLLAALAEPVMISGVEVIVTASLGVARCADDPAGSVGDAAARAEVLLHRADSAMYQVKRGNRSAGGWLVHDPTAADPTADRLRLLEQLRHAITQGQLRLHYQPRIDLADGRVTGVEALVRWAHPERGLLPPAHFIELAETSGLVRELGAWVLQTAIAQAAAWNSRGYRLQVGVNVSARQLTDPDLVVMVTSMLAHHGVPASQLVLEITETALMLDPEAAASTLSRLTDLGALVAVDDFGTGYASLTYLRRFPVHELKIDQSFVAGIVVNPGDRAIVTGCIQLAHALGLTSVAEGVETPAQRDVLRSLGCRVGQGYLFGRPQPPEALNL